jgi:hypothetical protein
MIFGADAPLAANAQVVIQQSHGHLNPEIPRGVSVSLLGGSFPHRPTPRPFTS